MCRAYQVGDQMICPCGLQWDANDPEPPHCPSTDAAKTIDEKFAATPIGAGRREFLKYKAEHMK